MLSGIAVLCSSVLVSGGWRDGSRINSLRDKVSESWERNETHCLLVFSVYGARRVACMPGITRIAFSRTASAKNLITYRGPRNEPQACTASFLRGLIKRICILLMRRKFGEKLVTTGNSSRGIRNFLPLFFAAKVQSFGRVLNDTALATYAKGFELSLNTPQRKEQFKADQVFWRNCFCKKYRVKHRGLSLWRCT